MEPHRIPMHRRYRRCQGKSHVEPLPHQAQRVSRADVALKAQSRPVVGSARLRSFAGREMLHGLPGLCPRDKRGAQQRETLNLTNIEPNQEQPLPAITNRGGPGDVAHSLSRPCPRWCGLEAKEDSYSSSSGPGGGSAFSSVLAALMRRVSSCASCSSRLAVSRRSWRVSLPPTAMTSRSVAT